MNPWPPDRRAVHLTQCSFLGELAHDREFLDLARKFVGAPCSAVLLSGGAPPVTGENRYSLAAWDPFLTFESKQERSTMVGSTATCSVEGNALATLDTLLASLYADFEPVLSPFCGGAVGYFAYELKNAIERLPQTAEDDLDLPEILLFWPRQMLLHDRMTRELHWLTFAPEGDPHPPDLSSLRAELLSAAELPGRGTAATGSRRPWSPGGDRHLAATSPGGSSSCVEVESNFSHENYLAAVRTVRDYIIAGDVYQVNLSQRLRFPFDGDGFALWSTLFAMNPAPFYAFVQGRDHQVLCTSMERFLFRQGTRIETRPIKGTRKRGGTPREDETLIRDLLASPKDGAELAMIVDLLRNDLGRVCLPRTIQVAEHKRLESYQNVHHLVSIVTGTLRPETSIADLLRATFPGGSVTGCPKIRAMEIIDEQEPNVRHVYTGSIGYVGLHGNLDLNIAIRTGIVSKGFCHFSVGGGIVFDSQEEDEYQETLHKGRTLLQLIDNLKRHVP
jgi:para-aminobenzoate synthetase component I